MSDVMTLIGGLCKELNDGRVPKALQEGEWLKLFFGASNADWVRVRRDSRLVYFQAPLRLAHAFKHVTLNTNGGIAECTVRDVEGYKFPTPMQHGFVAPPVVVPVLEAPTPAEGQPIEEIEPENVASAPPRPVADILADMTVAELSNYALGQDIEVPKHIKRHAAVKAYIEEQLAQRVG